MKMSAKKILIVDDDPGNLFILKVSLEEKGYTVMSAETAEEAIAKVQGQKPDAVVLDIMMPKMDGPELAQRLKKEPGMSDIPVFFVTCLQSKEEEAVPGFVVGRRMFAKPVDIEKLVAEINKSIGE